MNKSLIKQILDSSEDIVIMAPSYGKNAYRLYANGGVICNLTPTANGYKFSGLDINYERNYLSKQKEYDKSLPVLIQELKKNDLSELTPELEKYLSLAVWATELKFNGDERQYQTKLTAISGKNCKYCPDEKQWLIVDMEYTSPQSISNQTRNGEPIYYSPDYTIFDGSSFGIVELKCNGKSTDNFKKHSENFNALVSNNGREYIEHFISRFRALIEIGAVSAEYEKVLDEFEKNYLTKAIEDIVWIGFLFVDTEGEMDHKSKYVELIENINDIDFSVPVKIKHILPEEYNDEKVLTKKLISDEYFTISEFIN